MRLTFPYLALLLAGLGMAWVLAIQPPAADRFDSPEMQLAMARGKEVFLSHCTGCHGAEANGKGPLSEQLTGTRPRDFTQPEVAETPADSLRKTILLGGQSRNLNPMMPGWQTALSDQEIDDVVVFVQAVSRHGAIPPVLEPTLR